LIKDLIGYQKYLHRNAPPRRNRKCCSIYI
jgi:hypothetical protein